MSIPDNLNHSVACEQWPDLGKAMAVYAPMHAYFALIICAFGTMTNMLNVLVLLQRNMRSPTNALLTGVAVADSFTMIPYGIRTIYLDLATAPDPTSYPHSLTTVHLILLQNVISIGMHTISTVLLVQLAAFRCWILYVVTYPSKHKPVPEAGVERQKAVVKVGFVVAFAFGVLLAIPTEMIYQVRPFSETDAVSHVKKDETGTNESHSYWFELRHKAAAWEKVHFVLYGCFVKLLASVLILILSTFIMIMMRVARQRYMKLQSDSCGPRVSVPEWNKQNQSDCVTEGNMEGMKLTNERSTPKVKFIDTCKRRQEQKAQQSRRATVMLVVLVVSFVCTEAPQGVVNTLVATNGECFHTQVYMPLGDILDLFVLLNSSINFILYCTMSQMFRVNFVRGIRRWCPHHFCISAT